MQREEVGVAVLDVLLPDGDGIELLAELRARPDGAAMAILMLSTEADVKDRIRGLKTGADEYVGKPYDAKHIVVAHGACTSTEERGRGRRATDRASDRRRQPDISRNHELEAYREAGYMVLAAASGEEGLAIIADRRPTWSSSTAFCRAWTARR